MQATQSPLTHDTDARLPAAAYLRYEARADGWSAGRQAACLAHLADNGIAADAVRSVGMSAQGSYALRRQARGYAFNLGWEAALIIARRIVADDLMAAAIQGEQARWVREDGVTTYTRQNSKLALTLLDRVNPAVALPEVMAVAIRFDWFLQLIDEGATPQVLWDYFFDAALPHEQREARARVRAALHLSEESAGFDEEDDDDDDDDDDNEAAPMEYKSMEGAPLNHPAIGSHEDTKTRRSRVSGEASLSLQPCIKADGCEHEMRSAQALRLRVFVFWPQAKFILSDAAGGVEGCEPKPSQRCKAGQKSLVAKMPALHQRGHHAGRDHQHAAIIEIPYRKRDARRIRQRPETREDQQIRYCKGHCTKADAVSGEVAVPCRRRHRRDHQRIADNLRAEAMVGRQMKGDQRGERQHGKRKQFLAERRMHPPMPQKQYDRHDMAQRKGNRAPDHINFQQAIAQRPKGHGGGEQQKFPAMMLSERVKGEQPNARHLPRYPHHARQPKLPAQRIGQPEKQAGEQPWPLMRKVLSHAASNLPIFVILNLFQDNTQSSFVILKQVQDDDFVKFCVRLQPNTPPTRQESNPPSGPPSAPPRRAAQYRRAAMLPCTPPQKPLRLVPATRKPARSAHHPILPSPAKGKHDG
jgi:hypothetical protein